MTVNILYLNLIMWLYYMNEHTLFIIFKKVLTIEGKKIIYFQYYIWYNIRIFIETLFAL